MDKDLSLLQQYDKMCIDVEYEITLSGVEMQAFFMKIDVAHRKNQIK